MPTTRRAGISSPTIRCAPPTFLNLLHARACTDWQCLRCPVLQAEQDRLDLQHQLCKVFLDGQLYRAPIGSPRNVLDIATGTGIWAIQFAESHPQANVIGTDISLIQPEGPPNCQWVKEDAENQEWTLPTLFDYIHMRLVVSCFDDHRVVIQKAFDQLEPGGYLEMMDPTFEILCTDGTSTGTHIERFCNMLLEAANAVGRSFTVAKGYKQWLIEAGFVDVVEDVGPIPGEIPRPERC